MYRISEVHFEDDSMFSTNTKSFETIQDWYSEFFPFSLYCLINQVSGVAAVAAVAAYNELIAAETDEIEKEMNEVVENGDTSCVFCFKHPIEAEIEIEIVKE